MQGGKERTMTLTVSLRFEMNAEGFTSTYWLAYARAYVMTIEEYDSIIITSSGRKRAPTDKITCDNEMKAHQWVKELLEQRLNLYPTTADEDTEILKKENLPYFTFTAVSLRLEEK